MSELVGMGRIELPLHAPEARVLPVYYIPIIKNYIIRSYFLLVDISGFGPETFPMWTERSNQLSYMSIKTYFKLNKTTFILLIRMA